LVRRAADAGADAVKFQAFVADELVHPEVSYMGEALEIFARSELSYSDFRRLAELAQSEGVDFLATPFSPRWVHFLQELNVPAIKVASGDINNFFLLNEVAEAGLPVLLSTGASTEQEVDEAVEFLTQRGSEDIVILHCLSEYPAALEKVNWYSIPYFLERYEGPVGFSDHTLGTAGPVTAVAMGARVIEKHFTLDTRAAGADHGMSADPDTFARMVSVIRSLEQGFGVYGKQPTQEEAAGNSVGRRGLYYRSRLGSGDELQGEDLIALRPQNGISPSDIQRILGKTLGKDVERLEPVSWEDFQR
jgi:sialic acid synthase SpsE